MYKASVKIRRNKMLKILTMVIGKMIFYHI